MFTQQANIYGISMTGHFSKIRFHLSDLKILTSYQINKKIQKRRNNQRKSTKPSGTEEKQAGGNETGRDKLILNRQRNGKGLLRVTGSPGSSRDDAGQPRARTSTCPGGPRAQHVRDTGHWNEWTRALSANEA